MVRRLWTFAHVCILIAAILFFVAFCVSMGWFGSNYAAWLSAGLFFTAVAVVVPEPARP
jgi:hypothetical protein